MAYNQHTWVTGERIIAENLNNIESGVANNDTEISNINARLLDMIEDGGDWLIVRLGDSQIGDDTP